VFGFLLLHGVNAAAGVGRAWACAIHTLCVTSRGIYRISDSVTWLCATNFRWDHEAPAFQFPPQAARLTGAGEPGSYRELQGVDRTVEGGPRPFLHILNSVAFAPNCFQRSLPADEAGHLRARASTVFRLNRRHGSL
jgi:hypothetical protein